MLTDVILLVLGLMLLVKCADWLLARGGALARRRRMSELAMRMASAGSRVRWGVGMQLGPSTLLLDWPAHPLGTRSPYPNCSPSRTA